MSSKHMNVVALVCAMAVGGAVTLSACKPGTDLNRQCRLVQRNPDGGSPIPITEGEIRSRTGQYKDFIAIGTIDCEDLICVRDSTFSNNDAGNDDPAFGYCSSSCSTVGGLCPSYDSSLDNILSQRLTCRALLDKETLAALAGGDGGTPGNVRDPFFCARGTTPDAGM